MLKIVEHVNIIIICKYNYMNIINELNININLRKISVPHLASEEMKTTRIVISMCRRKLNSGIDFS